jgi:hypothetical protein
MNCRTLAPKQLSKRLRFLLLLIAVFTVACNEECNLSGQPAPQPYACGSVTSGHCYAHFTMGDHIVGFRTEMTVRNRFISGNGLMTNEFWLVNYQGVNGWIELGYLNNGHTPPYYFWLF